MTVKGDAGLQIVDNASTLLPDAPLLPLYEAVRRVEPDHDFDQYDIVTNRGELKKILSWILGEQKKEFRIEIETAGESRLLFRRWENQEFRPAGAQYYGRYAAPTVHYRNNFEQSTCFPVKGNEDAFSHVRVVAYVSSPSLPIHPAYVGDLTSIPAEFRRTSSFRAMRSGWLHAG